MKEKDPFNIAEKLFQYRSNGLSQIEREQLEAQLKADPKLKILWEEISNHNLVEHELTELKSYDIKEAYNKALDTIHPVKQISNFNYRWVAVCLAIITTFAVYISRMLSPATEEYVVLMSQQDTTKGVQLMLASGKHIQMDTLSFLQGKEATYTGDEDGLHIHSFETKHVSSAHKIIVPHKKKFQVVLSDGSKVFLNAGSTLTFPASFGAGERRVHLEGEAYFEVTHMPDKQFIVETGRQQVRVYGTVFNIKAYADESIHYTTLIEGSISVQDSGRELFLESGSQAQFDKRTGTTTVNAANLSMVSSWKDGWLAFDNLPLSEILRQIGRWYNLEVIIANNASEKISATGKILLYTDVNDVLRKFEKLDDIHFDVSESRISAKQINNKN